jgi:hypothetical protein
MTFEMWRRVLMAVLIGVIAFGIGFLIAPDFMHGFYGWALYGAPDAQPATSDQAAAYLKLMYAVLGAVLIGWSAALLMVTIGSFRRGEREAWNLIALSVVVWYGIDSALSLALGFPGNAAINTLFLVGFALPLAATFRHFYGSKRPLAAEQAV